MEEKPKPNREPLKRSRDAEVPVSSFFLCLRFSDLTFPVQVETMPVKRPRVVLDEVEYTPSGEGLSSRSLFAS